jgi:valyl-tRNA synthetase
MPIPKAYDASQHEDQIYQLWEKNNYFKPKIDPNKKPFTISMPPPNATGQLHLGHATMLALQDIMIRYHRMKGDPTLWLPGTDHAAIATQSKVEEIIAKEGKTRHDLGREPFLERVREYVSQSKDTIRNQVRKMGSSCDWSRERYTLDDNLNHAVNTTFLRMYNDGLIYRGGRIVNWDPHLQTTVSDDEVEYKEKQGKFYYFQYGPYVIGTARPETKFADKVVVVHPDDKRYQQYIGQELEVEWINGPIKAKVIADECVDMEMGTGAMTITPAHSLIDFELAEKYDLEVQQIIDLDGKLLPVAGEFAGMHIKAARAKIVEKLDQKGLLVKVEENYAHNLATNYRGGGIIEPQVLDQWFIDVNKAVVDWKGAKHSLKAIMLDVVRSNDIKIVPDRFNKVYFHWIENLRDWCISRQIWWGHRIPAWHKDGEIKVQIESPGAGWQQDEDTLDTWFSAGLWTFSTLGWPKDTEDLKYFHPTSVLETGYDILFFWVARMILMSTYALGEVPFEQVYLHGLVLDKQGKKMSKSKGNGIDPLDMIAKYGTDAVRLSLVIGATPGNNVRLYEEKIAGYRNFVNKLWNSCRFLLMICQDCEQIDHNNPNEFPINDLADRWITSRLSKTVAVVTEAIEKHAYSEAGTRIYEFLWDEYCDWYLEMSKGESQNPQMLVVVMQNILKMLHPYTPFVTEVLWEKLGTNQHLITEAWPQADQIPQDEEAEAQIGLIQNTIYQIRSIRSELRIDPAKQLETIIYTPNEYMQLFETQAEHLRKLARINSLTISGKGQKIKEAAHKILPGGIEIYLPLEGIINLETERERTNKEILATEEQIGHSENKLNNEGFTNNAAPEIVAKEQTKLSDLKAKLHELQARLEQLA